MNKLVGYFFHPSPSYGVMGPPPWVIRPRPRGDSPNFPKPPPLRAMTTLGRLAFFQEKSPEWGSMEPWDFWKIYQLIPKPELRVDQGEEYPYLTHHLGWRMKSSPICFNIRKNMDKLVTFSLWKVYQKIDLSLKLLTNFRLNKGSQKKQVCPTRSPFLTGKTLLKELVFFCKLRIYALFL